MKILLNVIKCVVMVILGFFLVVNVYIIVSKTILKNPVPQVFGLSMFRIETGSMEPELNIGDIIIVKKQNSDDYKVGDVITYYANNSSSITITHKIIERDGNTIISQGVNNNTADTPFDVSRIVGKVVFSISKLGNFIEFLKTPFGILCIIGVGFLIIEVPNWIDDYKEKKNKKEEKID